jgi:hypothetical protein
MKFPHVSTINKNESLLFFKSEKMPSQCAFCARTRTEPPVVRSTGARIDVYYSKESMPVPADERVANPICWFCVQDRSHGLGAEPQEWRTAAAGFLNALHASDPGTYYCALQDLG